MNGGVQTTHIDAQLQRIGGREPEQRPIEQLLFYFSPLIFGVPTPVPAIICPQHIPQNNIKIVRLFVIFKTEVEWR